MTFQRQYRVLLVVVECVIVATLLLHFMSVRMLYLKGVEEENRRIIRQIAGHFDTYLESIESLILQVASYDDELIELTQNYLPNYHYMTGIARKIDSLERTGQFLYSVYILLEGPGIVYSTSYIRPLPVFEFDDPEPFHIQDRSRGSVYRLPIRDVMTYEGSREILTFVADVPLLEETKYGTLVLNTDMQGLTHAIKAKTGVGDEFELHVASVSGADSRIVDSEDLLSDGQGQGATEIEFHGLIGRLTGSRFTISSTFQSTATGWVFRLYRHSQQPGGILFRASEVLIFALVSLIVFFLFAVSMSLFYRNSLKGILVSLDDMVWRSFLGSQGDRSFLVRRVVRTFRCGLGYIFAPVVICHWRDVDEKEERRERTIVSVRNLIENRTDTHAIPVKIISLDQRYVVIVLALHETETAQLRDIVEDIYISVATANNDAPPFIIVGEIQEDLAMVPSAVAGARLLSAYRLSIDKGIAFVKSDYPNARNFRYPQPTENLIIEALLSGDSQSLRLQVDEFVSLISRLESGLHDEEIIDAATTPCVRVAETLLNDDESGRAIRLFRGSGYRNVEELGESLFTVLQGFQTRLQNSKTYGTAVWKKRLIRYIDDHFTLEELNLNYLAELFGHDRSTVSKTVYELTGLRITEYVKHKRIERAKALLRDNEIPVEEVGREVGYRYAYYFIRIFKSLEGMTPGQYRNLHGAAMIETQDHNALG